MKVSDYNGKKRPISTNAGVQLKTCATPRPFSRATSPSLIVCLCLAYLQLLKLTAASNTGVYEKLAILDEYLVDHCGM